MEAKLIPHSRQHPFVCAAIWICLARLLDTYETPVKAPYLILISLTASDVSEEELANVFSEAGPVSNVEYVSSGIASWSQAACCSAVLASVQS